MSVTDYCRRLKGLADSLRDLGEPISDRTLVLNLIGGLSPRFATQAELLPLQVPFPTFASARSALLLAEMRHPTANGTTDGDTALLVATPSSQGNPTNKGKNGKCKGKGGGGGGGGGERGKGGGGGNAGSGDQKQPPLPPSGSWVMMAPWASAPWAGTQHGRPGLLEPRPVQPAQHVFNVQQSSPASVAGSDVPLPAAWDQAGLLAALNNLHTQGQPNGGWVMDTGATSHMVSSDGTLRSSRPLTLPVSITIGNGSSIPVSRVGNTSLTTPSSSYALNDVLLVPSLIQNLISVRKLTRDNFCSVTFDSHGFSIKDLRSGTVILRFNSSGDLYTIPASSPHALLTTSSPSTVWHRRLGHPGRDAILHLQKRSAIPLNTFSPSCHACRLGKPVKLPFTRSHSVSTAPFQLLHCDLWTSLILSNSGFRYYLIIVDDFSHYFWTFPLRNNSDVLSIFQTFVPYVHTQFQLPLQCLQTDSGREFIISAVLSFLNTHGILLRSSCPYTSQQNGKAERSIRTTNDVIRCLLLQGSMASSY
ncbi:hypothetical protein MLD38_021538 [Melastoma candidum]|uniref:Uncharacterized protein n=1 Tax=Melastoma candidum TaxID=119954 RepID=A0ACB9QFT2_9MYRT|nr:hypothetical protein MLD38_021538 [Melastoma candidum]